jgi:TonB family protein
MPTLLRQVEPRYPSAAREARVEGSVELECVVGANGTITDVRIVRSLDAKYGLDAEAVRAARGWLFRPGTREGKPVPVIITLILEFRLDDPRRTAEQKLFDDALAAETPGLVKPEPVTSSHPKYTPDALRARVAGVVELEVVVLPDGTVGAVRVVQSLDTVFGLDAAAVEAARSWTYTPGTLNGQAVPVLIRMTLSFKLH